MGVPLYLRTDNGTQFYIYMGFKSLPKSIMEKAEKDKAVLLIDQTKKYDVSRERFFLNGTSMIPIDYIPSSAKDYHFEITPVSTQRLIEKYWSNYADGFTYEGGLFTVTLHGGRKVRHGDNVRELLAY